MRQILIEDMELNKNYLAVIELNGETYYSTVSFAEGVGLIEYVQNCECKVCSNEAGDDWQCAEWMIQADDRPKFYEL